MEAPGVPKVLLLVQTAQPLLPMVGALQPKGTEEKVSGRAWFMAVQKLHGGTKSHHSMGSIGK